MENLKEASEIVTAFYKMNESGKQLHEVLPEIQKMIDGYKVKSDESFMKGKIEGLEEAKWQLGYALPHIDPNGRLEKQTRYLLDVFNKVQDELLREVEKVVGSTKIAEKSDCLNIVEISERPKIITIVGSTRFIDEISVIAWEFEKEGNIVLSPRLLPQGYANEIHLAEKENIKEIIDKTYLHKIVMANVIYVVNINGYIGESTRNELNFAIKLNKKIIYLEPDSKND